MSYVMKKNLANKANYGGKRSTSSIKYIVIHYTSNDGDHDESNANYFHNNMLNPKASAHYFIDDDSVTQSVPDDYVAYSVGGNKWSDCSKTGGGKLYGVANNANSINLEMCDTKKDGTIKATEATMANTAEFCKKLMKKYGIDASHVIRHFDVNGKHCPAYFMNEKEWAKFKARLTGSNTTTAKSEPKHKSKSKSSEFEVRVDISDLNIRKGPGTNYSRTGKFTGKGVFTIIKTSSGQGSKAGWGKLKSGAGWISLDHVEKIRE